MHKALIHLPEMKFLGIQTQTSNAMEMNPESAKIGFMINKYFKEDQAARMLHRSDPGTTYCIYTHYENGIDGEYTYFIGEKVWAAANPPEGLSVLTVPTQQYVKCTDGPGPKIDVCLRMWKKIWAMTPAELGGERRFLGDFEVYDKRAADPLNAILDIYIGLNAN